MGRAAGGGNMPAIMRQVMTLNTLRHTVCNKELILGLTAEPGGNLNL